MTKSQVNKLGKKLRFFIKSNEQPPNELLEKLQDYRISYKSDLSSVFEKISQLAKETRSDSITAFRIKRIETILSKIRRQPTMSLGNMGDIAGCRILVYSEKSILKIIKKLNEHFKVKSVNNYLEETKEDGYRGYHLYIESPINKYKTIEIQIRTIRSHKWASMVEIIDIIYNLKIKEGEQHKDFERFLLLLSKIEKLTLNEKKEIIEIDKKYKVISKLNEVFIKNNLKIRMDIGRRNNDYFIIEVNKEKNSNISSFEKYIIAEKEYFEKFKLNNNSNFVLTHIEKPNFKRVSIAYASYVLINDYLNDWYRLAKDLLDNAILVKKNKLAENYKSNILEILKSQLSLLNGEFNDVFKYKYDVTCSRVGVKCLNVSFQF